VGFIRLFLPVLVAIDLLSGCTEGNPLLSVVTEAWGREATETSHRAIATGLGFGAFAGALCDLDYPAWVEAADSGLNVSGPIAEWFGMEPVAVVEADESSGAFTASFRGGEVLGESATLGVLATTPGSLLEVSAHAIGKSSGILAEATFETSDCSAGEEGASVLRGVKGGVTFFSTDEKGFTLNLPSESDSDAIDRVLFDGSDLFPVEGRIGWTGRLSFGRATLVTYDAASIEASDDKATWPALAGGREWSQEVLLELP
jgi:hypothetical protein